MEFRKKRKVDKAERQTRATELDRKLARQQKVLVKSTLAQKSSTHASFMVAYHIAKHSKPFSDGEFIKKCMLDVADQVCPEQRQKFEEVSLSRRTLARRIETIGENLTSQLKGLVPSFQLFSLALDESTDVDDTAQLLIFVRGISENFEITEELLSMESMKDTTIGRDIFECVENAFRTMELPWQKMVRVTTDGCPSLTGKNVGLLRRLSDRVAEVDCTRKLIFLHCIIHQEVLCKNVLDMRHVVDPVVKIVNFIRARGLNHRQFTKLLEDSDSHHSDVPYHTVVRWLSVGKVLRRVWDLKTEILLFLEIKGKDKEFPQLKQSEWLSDLAFAVDLFEHMNELNIKLQGKGTFAHEMYSIVKAFRVKLKLFSRQLSQNITTHFATLATMAQPMMPTDMYTNIISALDNEFGIRFADFQKLADEFDILSSPFTADFEKAPDVVQLELIDLQCDSTLKEKFQSESIDKFYASLNASKFVNLRKMAMKLLVLFGSTYICEQTFLIMNINKTKLRSNLTDVHLQSLLRISTSNMLPEFKQLTDKFERPQMSH
ncbi:hypothetical protein RRG08_054608 [Elysia crispata]|uniref:General transcription factor II-I repeat domain-containing protein 2-like n=1 Tax=Elysia crispata TaxID=231223 RepID=A0AAE1E8M3_9GAST|nr:hypothetical protein RRG08_054608 [Elysia crispata]